MLEVIFAFLCSLVAAIFNSEMDTILFKPDDAWFKTDWWRKHNLAKNWWTKVPFSFLADGWHLCKAVQEFCYALIIGLVVTTKFNLPWYYCYFFAVGIYALRGAVWELFYKLKNEFQSLE